MSVGGVYKPRSWYEKEGYVLDDKFEDRKPCEWNAGLNQWTYLLAETAISEAEISRQVEESLLEAERAARKRKAPAEEEKENAEQPASSKGKEELVDLLSESDGEAPIKSGGRGPLSKIYLSFFLSFLCLVMEHFQLCQAKAMMARL